MSIYLYTMALLAVSSLVGTTEDGKVPHWRLVHSSLVEKKRLLLRSALLVFGLAILSTVAAGALFWVVLHIPVLKQKMGFELGAIVGLFVEVALFALYIAGPALMLLRSTEVPPSLGSVRLARISAVAAVIAQTSVILLINRAPNSPFPTKNCCGASYSGGCCIANRSFALYSTFCRTFRVGFGGRSDEG